MFSYFDGLNFLTCSKFNEIFSDRQQRREHFVAFCCRESFKTCVQS